MNLIDQIRKDQVAIRKQQAEARKNKDAEGSAETLARADVVVPLLTTLIGEAEMVGKNDGNRAPTDLEVVAKIKWFIGKIDETLSKPCTDVVQLKFKVEKEVLNSYLPKQMSADELLAAIQGQEKNKSVVMKFLKEKFAGQYDGKMAAGIVDQYIKS